MKKEIYNDSNGYKLEMEFDGEKMNIFFTNSGATHELNIFPICLDLSVSRLFGGAEEKIKSMGANPADYKLVSGKYIIRKAAIDLLEIEAAAIVGSVQGLKSLIARGWRATYAELFGEVFVEGLAAKIEVTHCERCRVKIEGEPVWKKGFYGKIQTRDPYCQNCAGLLKMVGAGENSEWNQLGASDFDATPYHKEEDF